MCVQSAYYSVDTTSAIQLGSAIYMNPKDFATFEPLSTLEHMYMMNTEPSLCSQSKNGMAHACIHMVLRIGMIYSGLDGHKQTFSDDMIGCTCVKQDETPTSWNTPHPQLLRSSGLNALQRQQNCESMHAL